MRRIILTLLLLWASKVSANDSVVQLGIGTTSLTSGRHVPSLQVGYENSNLAVAFSSTGYKTRYDFMSGYILSAYKIHELGTFWGMRAQAGFGLGTYYTQRGFRETPESELKNTDDFGIGPAFRVGIYPFDFFYIRVEAMYAMGSLYNLLLVFQDAAQLTIGVSF